jgi:hypothetical protein
MFPQKAITDFSRFENDELDEKTGTIIEKLTDNAADFPALIVAIAVLTGLHTAYHDILIAPLYDGQGADLKAARKKLEKALKKNGVYVNQVADGDEVLLAKSGYPISDPHTPIGQLAQASFKSVTSISKGFDIKIDVVKKAKGYLVLVCESSLPVPDDFSDWKWFFLPKTKGLINGLKASTKYRMICVGLGTDLNLNYSEPIERTTQ